MPRPGLWTVAGLTVVMSLVAAMTFLLPAPSARGDGGRYRGFGAVTGKPDVGQVLFARGAWTFAPQSLSYQWLRNGQPIPRAASASYSVTGSDFGARLSARITARTGSRSVTITTTPSTPVSADVYATPGTWRVNGRQWRTSCERYSQTQRCRTQIWATTVTEVGGRFVQTSGWVHNNLTYLPMTPDRWATNPLGHTGRWSSAGRQWRTECHTPATGYGCRVYIYAKKIVASPNRAGGYDYSWQWRWVLNNMVQFAKPATRPTITAVRPGVLATGGGSTLEISGTGLSAVTGVVVGGVAATAVQALSDRTLLVTSPPIKAGTAEVTVLSPAGRSAPARVPAAGSGEQGFPVLLAAALAQRVNAVEAQTGARIGVALAPVGSRGAAPLVAGSLTTAPGWSTMKVPLVMAVQRRAGLTGTRGGWATAAITRSDNDAAARLYAALGSPATASGLVEAELARHQDGATAVPTRQLRPPFSVIGQARWSVANSARFAATLPCSADAQPVWRLMGQVQSSQRWGIGRIPGVHFKSGWGPEPNGRYVVRQIGTLPTSGGEVAVSLLVQGSDGSFSASVAALDQVAAEIGSLVGQVNTAGC